MKNSFSRIAMVYDRITKIGGAERVLTELQGMYKHAPLFTAVYNSQQTPWADDWDIRPSFMNSIPHANCSYELFPWLTPLSFESFSFNGFEVVLSVTSAEAKGIITRPQTLHVCYCLTPTRYLWHDKKRYKKRLPKVIQLISKPFYSYAKAWDLVACNRPDEYLAISQVVRKRIEIYYKRSAQVIYPPVNVDFFQRKSENSYPSKIPREPYFLVVSRLVPYKRVDIAIRACDNLELPLVVVGDGMDKKHLKRIASSRVTFTGQLTDDELVRYYQSCRGLIFPQQEDFGIVAVEAMAAGKPVLAYNQGGAKETVVEGKTGLFFSVQSEEVLTRALKTFSKTTFKPEECHQQANKFSASRFRIQFSKKMEELWEKHQKTLEQ